MGDLGAAVRSCSTEVAVAARRSHASSCARSSWPAVLGRELKASSVEYLLRLARPAESLRWRTGFMMRGVEKLPITF
jgi:hypothetical protein